jgi:hypothetical protein
MCSICTAFQIPVEKSMDAGNVDWEKQSCCNCSSSSVMRKVAAENVRLQNVVADLECEMQRMKLEKKKLLRDHKADMKWREKKEASIVVLGVVCVLVYVVVALLTRGFV